MALSKVFWEYPLFALKCGRISAILKYLLTTIRLDRNLL